MALIQKQERENFISILSSDASLRKVVDENTTGAVKREYEDSKGNKGIKHELIYSSVSGLITDIKFVDTDYGTLLQVELTDNEDKEILSLSTSSSFGEDFMKKLPNIDLKQSVILTPYKIEKDNGKELKGLSIKQEENKILNFFWDVANKESINGFPTPKGDTKTFSKDKWKMYFLECREFLTEYTKSNFVTKTSDLEINVDDINY